MESNNHQHTKGKEMRTRITRDELIGQLKTWRKVAELGAKLTSEDQHTLVEVSNAADVVELVKTLAVDAFGDDFRLATCSPVGIADGYDVKSVYRAVRNKAMTAKSHWERAGHTWIADMSTDEAIAEAQ